MSTEKGDLRTDVLRAANLVEAVAPVGDKFVALPLAGAAATRAGFLPASGLIDGAPAGLSPPSGRQSQGSRASRPGPVRSVRPIGPPRPTLVVAGSDPALPLLEIPLSLLDPPVAFAWWPCGGEEALGLAGKGLVQAAEGGLADESGGGDAGLTGDLQRQGPGRSDSARGARAW